jgi:hypothetical protein
MSRRAHGAAPTRRPDPLCKLRFPRGPQVLMYGEVGRLHGYDPAQGGNVIGKRGRIESHAPA